MMLSRIAFISGLSITCGVGFAQDPRPRSLHEVIAAMEADLQGISTPETRANALPRLSPGILGELTFPIAPPRREIAPSTPISVARLNHKVPGGAKRAYQKALKLEQEGKVERALEEYHRAITLDPDYFEAHSDLGVLYHRLQRYADAETEFRRAAALAPELSEVQSNLGWALLTEGKIAEAETSARQALRMWNGNYKAHRLLGRILASAPETRPEAIEHLEAAVKLLSSSVDRPIPRK